jgi:hypothetical protein
VCLGYDESGDGTVGWTGINRVCVWSMETLEVGELVVMG